MKKMLAVVFLVALVAAPARAVLGQDGLVNDTSVNYNQDARQARINELKSVYRITLSESEQQDVSVNCKVAQKNLVRLSGELSQVTIVRRKVYMGSISSLKNVRLRLSTSQIDSSNLELMTVSYQQKLKAFEVASENYVLTIEDAVTLDCSEKPEDFRAALEGVRAARKKVVTATSEITEITRSSLKTTTDTLTARLLVTELAK